MRWTESHPLDLRGVSPYALRRFAVDCVSHVLGPDTPDACRVALEQAIELTVELAALRDRLRRLLPARGHYGIEGIAIDATIAALAPDPAEAAVLASDRACTLAGQRAMARHVSPHIRERGDAADDALAGERSWQLTRLDSARSAP